MAGVKRLHEPTGPGVCVFGCVLVVWMRVCVFVQVSCTKLNSIHVRYICACIVDMVHMSSDLSIVYELYIIILCMYMIIIILCTYIGVFILHTTDNVTVFPSIVTFIIKLSNFYLSPLSLFS